MLFGKPTRRMWIVAIGLSLLCVGALAFALVTNRNTAPDSPPAGPGGSAENGGLGLGLVIGIGAGIVIVSLLAARKSGGQG